MADKQRIVDAAITFAEAHKAWAETLPRNRKQCLMHEPGSYKSCYKNALEEERDYFGDPEGYGFLGGANSELETDDWCESCKYNMQMALTRAERAAKRTGALKRLINAVEQRRRDG